MAKPGDDKAARGLEVRGTIDPEKFKAARALGGDEVKFELRAINPKRGGTTDVAVSCVVCLICVICVVCFAAKADEFGIKDLPLLEG